MHRNFTVLQNGKINVITVAEDDIDHGTITAVKSVDKLNEEAYKEHVRDIIYRMCIHTWERFSSNYAYNWQIEQSSFSDDSSFGTRYSTYETIGEAIKAMILDGFTIYIGNELFS